jgi:hypothetical protein
MMFQQESLFDVGKVEWLACSSDPLALEFAADVAGVERSVFVDPAELVWDDFDLEVE